MHDETWTLSYHKYNGKEYCSENFDNEADAIAEGDRFYSEGNKDSPWEEGSYLQLVHHVSVEEQIKEWDND